MPARAAHERVPARLETPCDSLQRNVSVTHMSQEDEIHSAWKSTPCASTQKTTCQPSNLCDTENWSVNHGQQFTWKLACKRPSEHICTAYPVSILYRCALISHLASQG